MARVDGVDVVHDDVAILHLAAAVLDGVGRARDEPRTLDCRLLFGLESPANLVDRRRHVLKQVQRTEARN